MRSRHYDDWTVESWRLEPRMKPLDADASESDGHPPLWKDDRGEHSIEFLMILTFGVLPLIGAVFLLEDVLREYVSF